MLRPRRSTPLERGQKRNRSLGRYCNYSVLYPTLNGDPDYIANLDGVPDEGYSINLDISRRGLVTVTTARDEFTKTYQAVPRNSSRLGFVDQTHLTLWKCVGLLGACWATALAWPEA